MLAAHWILRLGVSILLLPSSLSFFSTYILYIREEVPSKFPLSRSPVSPVSPCPVICDSAIPRRATPFRSRRPGRERRKEGSIGHQCLLPTRYLALSVTLGVREVLSNGES